MALSLSKGWFYNWEYDKITAMSEVKNNSKLPEFFRPLFWSYDFDSLDLANNQKIIILNTINYGDLKHWRWLKNYYGKPAISQVLKSISATELKRRAGKLAEILFEIKLNYAPRGAH